MIPVRTAVAASATAPGPDGTKIVLLPAEEPMCCMVSKYWVIIIISMTSLEVMSVMSCWKCTTLSLKPLMMACL